MDAQLKAGFVKELLAFSRSKKLIILICVFIGLSLFSPLMIRGMSLLMNAMSDTYDQFGMDVSGLTDELGSSASLGVSSQIGDFSSTGLLVFLLVINSFAGGEQKRRSVIIPHISGLGSLAYILPKFIIYPIAMFILSFIGTLSASWISALVFETNDLLFSAVVSAGLVLGVYNMFYVCLHIALGTSTGKPGMSSAVCIVASMLLPNILSIANATPAYNPFTMNLTAGSVLFGGEKASSVITGIAIALVIMVVTYFISLFVQNVKRIDNSGSEILI